MKKYIGALIVLEILLFIFNYTPGTYLVGWDNVMPEFNLWLNFKRSIFSLWQEYRGLGLVDGMAHSANLIHTIYIALLGIFLPESVVRYAYIHLTHLAGGIGFFLLARKLFAKSSSHTVILNEHEESMSLTQDDNEEVLLDKSSRPTDVPSNNNVPAFLAALFYMLNIGVIQMYYAPLEVFATHFAALPILALTTYNALKDTTAKNLALLFFSALLLSQQAFVPTVFIAYAIVAGFQIIFSLFGKSKTRLKHILLVAATLFLANIYWLIPYTYSALTTPQIIAQTRINEFSSEEIFYRNKARGNTIDTLTFKGFMLDSLEYDQQNSSYFQFMGVWANHVQNYFVTALTLIFGILAIAGIIRVIYKRDQNMYPFIGTGLIAFFFLANDTPLLEQANALVRSNIPLVGEAFRFPFTKFITVFAFCLSLFFGYILLAIRFRQKLYTALLSGVIGFGILFLAYPVFRGYFTAPQLRLEIPEYYQDTFDYFSSQPHDARVALMPSETFWNWGYTSWGHRGSGFIWHGIPQAFLTRAFDPWSLQNEQFYNELSHAQTTENPELFARVLRKYDIHYLLLDTSILNSLSRQPVNYDEIQLFFSKVPGLKIDRTMGKVLVYKTDTPASFLYALNEKQTVKAAPSFVTSREDTISSLIGNYVVTAQNPDIFTPFPALSTDKLQQNSETVITQDSTSITFTPKNLLPTQVNGGNLVIPSYFQEEFLIPVAAKTASNGVSLVLQYPTITINGKEITYPTQEITLGSTISNPTTVTFPDIDHTIDIDSDSLSYLIRTPATTVVVSNGTQSESFVIDVTQQNTSSIVVPLTEETIQSFSLKIPKIQSPLSERNALDGTGYTIQTNPTESLTYLTTPYSQSKKVGSAVAFTARNSSIELALYKENLYHQASYLTFIEAKYQQGLPVNFYIDNTFRERAIVENKLSKTNDSNVIVLPRTEQYFQGYGFHVIVKSVGKETAKATIQSLSLYPAPLETIKRIRIADIASPVFAQQSADQAPLTYSKPNFMQYTATVSPDDYLVLSQNENSGWNAYAVNPNSWLQKVFPFLGAKLEKVTVNNWKNAWKLPDGKTASTQITVLFLPIYFQIAGLVISAIGLLIYVFITVRSLFRQKSSIIPRLKIKNPRPDHITMG